MASTSGGTKWIRGFISTTITTPGLLWAISCKARGKNQVEAETITRTGNPQWRDSPSVSKFANWAQPNWHMVAHDSRPVVNTASMEFRARQTIRKFHVLLDTIIRYNQ
jgi:hypothetical protein